VWSRLGTALSTDTLLKMQSSNGTLATTAGLLRDFPFKIGPITFHVQVQVTDDLPCEILLGRPFFSLTNAVTVDYEDGSMDLELTDPNSGRKIRVPTHEKKSIAPS